MLERLSPVPLWQQMADSIRGRMDCGELAPGDQLPSEAELGAAYGVSRITVRRAIDMLLADERVVRAQGKGTFVATAMLRHDLSHLTGIIDSIHANGVRPRTRLTEFGHGIAPARVAELLGTTGEDVMHFRRLYEADGAPVGLADVWIPSAGMVSQAQADQASAYTILAKHLGVTVAAAQVAIKAQGADRGVLQHLGLSRGACLLRFERTSRCAVGIAREHTRFWVRSENYEFSLSVNGPIPISSALRLAA